MNVMPVLGKWILGEKGEGRGKEKEKI